MKRSRKPLYEWPYRLTEQRARELLDNYWDGVKWSSHKREPLWMPPDLVKPGEPELTAVLLELVRVFGKDKLGIRFIKHH